MYVKSALIGAQAGLYDSYVANITSLCLKSGFTFVQLYGLPAAYPLVC